MNDALKSIVEGMEHEVGSFRQYRDGTITPECFRNLPQVPPPRPARRSGEVRFGEEVAQSTWRFPLY